MINHELIGRVCPICGNALIESGRSYSVDELFALWLSMHKFSQAIIDEHRAASSHTQLYSCKSCRLGIYLPPVIGTPSFYEELHSDTDLGYYVEDKWDFQEAEKDIQSDWTILEVGCGLGAFLERAKPIARHAIGVEANPAAIRKVEEKGLVVFRPGEVDSEMRGQFDAVFSFHVLEHVQDPIAFIRDLSSWAKPGGIIGISVPNQDGPIKYIDPCIMNMPPHHATQWRRKTFEIMAERLGFRIERVAYEPLIPRDSYYYSRHFVNSIFQADSAFHRVLRKGTASFIGKVLSLMFRLADLMGRNSIGAIRGQSLYVVLSKPGNP